MIVLMLVLSNLVKLILHCNAGDATQTIYIRADGSVEPESAPISSIGNVTYVFTANISESIVIERDNITLDGKGHMLQGIGNGTGLALDGRNNVTVRNVKIENFSYGIHLQASSNIIIFNNTIKSNIWDGIYAVFTDFSTIYGNNISANKRYGLEFSNSGNNRIFHNNFVQNTENHTYLFGISPNIWDDGYPSGGNYWSNYTGTDLQTGESQNIPGSDGLGDTAHGLYAYNQDDYPLIAPITLFDAGVWNNESLLVEIVSNSTVSNFRINATQKTITFNVTSETTTGFSRITIPNIIVQDMWQGNYTVLVDEEQPSDVRNWTEEGYVYIYVTYPESNHEVTIVPEISTPAKLLFLALSTAAVITAKKRFSKNPQNRKYSY